MWARWAEGIGEGSGVGKVEAVAWERRSVDGSCREGSRTGLLPNVLRTSYGT